MATQASGTVDDDVWHLALVQVLGSYAIDPAATQAAAWKLVASAPPAMSVSLTHMLQLLVAYLAFELEGRYLPTQTPPFAANMQALEHLKIGRSAPLLLLVPFILARCSWTGPVGGKEDSGLERLAELARDRQQFRLAQDAWWPNYLLADSLALANRFEDALHAGYHALALAVESGVAVYEQQSSFVLGYILLSMDDVEGALGVLHDGSERVYGKGMLNAGVMNTHLLALVLSGRLNDAAALVARHPQMEDRELMVPRLGLRATKALLHLAQGDAERALDVLGPDVGGWSPQGKAVMANRCWIRARILLALGRNAEAASVCVQGLIDQQERGFTVSPLNRSQIHRATSEALDRLGQHDAAKAADEQARAGYLDWLKSATRARLVAMGWKLDVAPEVDAPKLASVALLEQLTQHLPPDAAAGPNFRMVAQVSHEMRNPIAGMLGVTSLLMNTHLDEKQKRYIALARSSAEMLMSLCNDLLDMAQLDNGRFALRPAPCDVGQASRQACQTFVSHAISKGLVLKFEIDHPSLGHWVCDELRYKQVLMNLLSNAVKFTPREGAVLVRVGLLAGADPQVLVEVQDTGPGISATQQQRLFQDFSQLPNQSETQHADMAVHGAGLGLALCRRLVKQMKGEMGVRSTAGGGSTFWFRMPVSRETRTQGAAEQSA